MREKLRDDRGQVGIGTLIVFIALVLVAAIAAGVLINTAGFLQTQAEQTGQDSSSQVSDNVKVIGETGNVIAAPTSTGPVTTDNYVYEARITVQRSPGSGNINLENLAIQWVGDNGFAQLVHVGDSSVSKPTDLSGNDVAASPTDLTNIGGSGDRGDPAYLIDEVTAETSSDAVLTSDGDRYEIVIPLGIIHDGTNTALVDSELDSSAGEGDANPSVSALSFSDEVDTADFDNADLGLLDESQSAELEITTDSGAIRNLVVLAPDTLIDKEGGTVTL